MHEEIIDEANAALAERVKLKTKQNRAVGDLYQSIQEVAQGER